MIARALYYKYPSSQNYNYAKGTLKQNNLIFKFLKIYKYIFLSIFYENFQLKYSYWWINRLKNKFKINTVQRWYLIKWKWRVSFKIF